MRWMIMLAVRLNKVMTTLCEKEACQVEMARSTRTTLVCEGLVFDLGQWSLLYPSKMLLPCHRWYFIF